MVINKERQALGIRFLEQQGEKMNTDIAEGKWTQVKGKLRESWGDLTDDEIEQTKGNTQQLVGLLQERYGLAKDQAEKEVEALTK